MAGRGSTAQRIELAVQRLAREKPIGKIRLSDVARESGLSWPTVKRHVESPDRLRAIAEGRAPSSAAPDTRGRLLGAAASLIAKSGYDAASLDAIAAEAGLTKGAVYWHFENKEALVAALAAEIVGVAASSSGDDAQRAIFARLSGAHQQPRLLLELFAASRAPAIAEVVLERLRRARERGTAEIEELQQRGVMSGDSAPRDVAVLLEALSLGVLVLSTIDPDAVEAASFLPEVARLLAIGLGEPSAGAPATY